MCDISHRSASHFKDIVGQVGCFWVFGVLFIFFLGVLLPKKKQRKNRRKDKPATWERRGDCHSAGVWWLSGSSPPLQMWRKHTLLFLFSPLCHPPPRPPLCSLFLSFPLLISSPCLACCFLTLHASAYSLGISLPLSPFIYLFIYLSGLPHSSFTPTFFSSFHPLSGDEWVEWSIVPWRLLCHPLFRRARLCVHECVYLKSPHTTRKMDIPFYSGLNKRSELLLHRCCPTNI